MKTCKSVLQWHGSKTEADGDKSQKWGKGSTNGVNCRKTCKIKQKKPLKRENESAVSYRSYLAFITHSTGAALISQSYPLSHPTPTQFPLLSTSIFTRQKIFQEARCRRPYTLRWPSDLVSVQLWKQTRSHTFSQSCQQPLNWFIHSSVCHQLGPFWGDKIIYRSGADGYLAAQKVKQSPGHSNDLLLSSYSRLKY